MSRITLSKLCHNVLFNQSRLATLCFRNASTSTPQDQETHTGQKFEPKDYRLARFVDRPKHVNPNFSIKLIEEAPPKSCKDRVVWCDGGSGPEGHPRVYINLDKPGNHSCGYCGLRFYKDGHHH